MELRPEWRIVWIIRTFSGEQCHVCKPEGEFSIVLFESSVSYFCTKFKKEERTERDKKANAIKPINEKQYNFLCKDSLQTKMLSFVQNICTFLD